MGTKPLSEFCKRTLTPRVTGPTGSYTLLRKEVEEKISDTLYGHY